VNAAYIHLTLNHFPPMVAISALLILVIGALWRSEPFIRAGFVLIAFAGLMAVPTFLSGDGAADIVKNMPGVNRQAISPHDESANVTVTILVISGVVALACLWIYRRRELPRWSITLVLILSLVSSAAATYTSMLGGRIHHPEVDMKAAPGR
jgi:uncharacterized membrane protein